MDFVKSHFGKMQLWIVEHFHLHRKVPVVINHNVWFFKCYDSLVQVPFCEDESVQLFRVAFCQSDFLQNPYFSEDICYQKSPYLKTRKSQKQISWETKHLWGLWSKSVQLFWEPIQNRVCMSKVRGPWGCVSRGHAVLY